MTLSRRPTLAGLALAMIAGFEMGAEVKPVAGMGIKG